MFSHPLRVSAADLDAQAHVNNVVYVRWIEEVAVAHWLALTTAEVRARVGWVLVRHEIDYHRPATIGEEILLRTVVPHMERIKVERHTAVYRLSDGETLARSRSLWVPVDPRTGRPVRVGRDLRASFLEPGMALPVRLHITTRTP